MRTKVSREQTKKGDPRAALSKFKSKQSLEFVFQTELDLPE